MINTVRQQIATHNSSDPQQAGIEARFLSNDCSCAKSTKLREWLLGAIALLVLSAIVNVFLMASNQGLRDRNLFLEYDAKYEEVDGGKASE